MSEACGCPDRTGHVDPVLDTDLMIGHGERSALCDDPPPHDVPGTGGWNGVYMEIPDAYCLCGHPNHRTCVAVYEHGIAAAWVRLADRPD